MVSLCWLATPTLESQLDIRFSLFNAQLHQRFPSLEATERASAWRDQLISLERAPELEQVTQTNYFFHRIVRYQTDDQLYEQDDYWATPLELLGHGFGDCEDWAIAKYISLRKLGISDQKLRLIYVRANLGWSNNTQAHMVLGYYVTPNAEPLILDSLISDVLPASQRDDLKPVFSFNSEGLWAESGQQRANSSPTARMSPWRDVLDRMRHEGIIF